MESFVTVENFRDTKRSNWKQVILDTISEQTEQSPRYSVGSQIFHPTETQADMLAKLPSIAPVKSYESSVRESARKGKRERFYSSFLDGIKSNKAIYESFIGKAKEVGILPTPRINSNEYYYDFMNKGGHIIKYASLSRKRSLGPLDSNKSSGALQYKSVDSSTESLMKNQFTSVNTSTESLMDKKAAIKNRYRKRFRQREKQASYHPGSRPDTPNTKKFSNRNVAIRKPRQWLNRKSLELQNIYCRIAGIKQFDKKQTQITPEHFEKFLNLRYPAHISKVFIYYLPLSIDGRFEDYCRIIDNLIGSKDDKVLQMIFNWYDRNGDHLICFSDAYQTMTNRANTAFDSDLALINEMLEYKKNCQFKKRSSGIALNKPNSLVQSQRSTETFLRSSFVQRNRDFDSNRDKPEALKLEDFKQIEFKLAKPGLYQDLIQYITGESLFSLLGLVPPDLVRKRSEELLFEQQFQTKQIVKDMNGQQRMYFIKLNEQLQKFPISLAKILMKKFAILESNDVQGASVITEESFAENFPTLFGHRCQYFARRVYKVLSKGFTLDKCLFLSEMHKMLNASQKKWMQFVFRIYNVNNDGSIRAHEACDLLDSLPENSKIYKEVGYVSDQFIGTHLGNTLEEVTEISFRHFRELVPYSWLPKELIDTFGLDQMNQNPSFNIPKANEFLNKRRSAELLSPLVTGLLQKVNLEV